MECSVLVIGYFSNEVLIVVVKNVGYGVEIIEDEIE